MKFYYQFRWWHYAPIPKKILRIMRLTIIIITIGLLQVSAAGRAQKVSLDLKKAPMEQVLQSVKQQTGYNFLYTTAVLAEARPVTIKVKDAALDDVLKICFANQPLVYTLEEKTVIIKQKVPSLIENIKEKLRSFLPGDSVIFKGRVLDAFGQPLPGASVKVKGTNKATFTTREGNFAVFTDPNSTLQISYIGYQTQELKLRREDAGLLRTFNMKPLVQDLGQVDIVSDGYQNLPKERATGSFEVITKEQLLHSNDPNLIKRLEGITTGMDFNNPQQPNLSSTPNKLSPLAYLTIRGRNSLITQTAGADPNRISGIPLVVIDGIVSTTFAIDNINPNDVENVNILKDAAAASIWGSRAANGVIVITTKKGAFNKKTIVSFNSNINITDKIDLFYKNLMTTSDFIDAQVLRYASRSGIPIADPTSLTVPQLAMSPVEEIMNDLKLGRIDQATADARLNALRGNDVRNDINRYILRKAITQTYSLSFDGGSEKYSYRLAGGYDQIRNNTIASDGNRYTVNYSASVKPLKNLMLNAVVGYNQANSNDQDGSSRVLASGVNTGFFPYDRLADDLGNPLPTQRAYRQKYLDLIANAYGSKILSMTYKPLENMSEGYTKRRGQGINVNLNASYKILEPLSASVTYGYNWRLEEENNLKRPNSYFMRELINRFTDPTTFVKNIPPGGLYSPNITKLNNQTLRGQLNFDKTWADKHELTAIAGAEINQDYSNTRLQQFYGYDEKTLATNVNLSYTTPYPRLFVDPVSGSSFGTIPYSNGLSDFKTRGYSFYSNAAYTYNRRYTVSGSVRKDVSSVFGRGTNKNGAPYFSVGAGWNISNESFYHLEWLPTLALRTSFGYNGNVNAAVTAVPLLILNSAPTDGNMLPYAATDYITNPQLRPEKSGMFKIALNFAGKNSRISGNIEYFLRKTTDMIANAALDPTTGFNRRTYNSANIRSQGLDINLSSLNIQDGLFRWTSNFLFSYNKVKVMKLFASGALTASQVVSSLTKVEGYELSRVVAYKWAGLDPQTGDPMGYVNGVATRITGSNSGLQNSSPESATRYFGSAVPVYFGALRNTFGYGSFSLSASIQYKLGYYFKKGIFDVIRYDALFRDNVLGSADYAKRWQKPGDEKFTNVPSISFPTEQSRDQFYQDAEINVLKGDHIRLQEINLSYVFKNKNWFIKNPRIYVNVSNLGVLWRANKEGIDPDVNDYPVPRTYSLGLSANF